MSEGHFDHEPMSDSDPTSPLAVLAGRPLSLSLISLGGTILIWGHSRKNFGIIVGLLTMLTGGLWFLVQQRIQRRGPDDSVDEPEIEPPVP